jgi:glyoxylase-like metal-dependent hydrolase (beta-lactamase superfamily II)
MAATINQLVLGDIATNCWIVAATADGKTGLDGASAKPCTIIDPADQADLIIAHLKSHGLRPEYILLTHGHFDHVGALPELARTYPGAIIAIHRDDADYLGSKALEAMPAPGRLLEDGDSIGPFTVLSLPGHTPGSAGFYLPGEKILFSGDTLFRDGVGRTDLPGGSQEVLERSLKRLLAMDGEIEVYSGHGNSTHISRERQ